MRRYTLYMSLALAFLISVTACNKDEKYAPDPYAGGKPPLEIKFADALPSPTRGTEGTTMEFQVTGAKKYEDKLTFLVNGTEAEILEVTDNTISIVLPAHVSTGGTQLVVDGQIYPGPLCEIVGKVEVDPAFNSGNGANGAILTIKRLSNSSILIGGYFTDYNGAASSTDINGIARIAANGAFVTGMEFGEGVKSGAISTIHQLNTNTVLIGGDISQYDSLENINNMTTIRLSGKLQTQEVEVLNLTSDPANSYRTVPVFNGGTNGPIGKSFVYDNKITVLGSFLAYQDHFYERSTINTLITGRLLVGGVVRMHLDGSLDSTFNMNIDLPVPEAYEGFRGSVHNGYMQDDGKLVVVGGFRRYNGQTVSGNIIRINEDGTLDQSFAQGAGANAAINNIAPTASGKFIISGTFTKYDGQDANGIALINADGSLDNSFATERFSGGTPLYTKELGNGKLLVTGTFKKYGDIVREGLCVLNPDGSLADGYNNTGKLDGVIYDALEEVNSNGELTVTLVGNFKRFNGKSGLGNIVKLIFRD